MSGVMTNNWLLDFISGLGVGLLISGLVLGWMPTIVIGGVWTSIALGLTFVDWYRNKNRSGVEE